MYLPCAIFCNHHARPVLNFCEAVHISPRTNSMPDSDWFQDRCREHRRKKGKFMLYKSRGVKIVFREVTSRAFEIEHRERPRITASWAFHAMHPYILVREKRINEWRGQKSREFKLTFLFFASDFPLDLKVQFWRARTATFLVSSALFVYVRVMRKLWSTLDE